MDLAAPWFTWEGTSSLARSRGNRCHENTQEPREQFTVQAGEQWGGLGERGRKEGIAGGVGKGHRKKRQRLRTPGDSRESAQLLSDAEEHITDC